ncbi:MAG: hypothetical protein IJC94_02345, partial [Oscillospiraceae bacterium]|nr:hypothetical protein [Oscillospiraceae bacterium]
MLKEQQDSLFEEWRKNRSCFVTDGIVDEQEYLNSPRKILFLLKEVNGGEKWNLCEFLKDGAKSQTWNNVARWTKGIFEIEREIPWSEFDSGEEQNERIRKEMLAKICVVNIKKAPGGNTSIKDEIDNAAEQDADFLKRQINIYNPEIIVCGGTGTVYSHKLANSKIKWLTTS